MRLRSVALSVEVLFVLSSVERQLQRSNRIENRTIIKEVRGKRMYVVSVERNKTGYDT